MIQLHDDYYKKKGLQNTGDTLAKRIIMQGWKTIRKTWDRRNTNLHDPKIIKKLEGFNKLKAVNNAE